MQSLSRSLLRQARATPSSARSFTSSPLLLSDKPASVPIALISKIRTARPGTPLSLARSALQASANDVPSALAWLAAQAAETGAAKAAKLSSREASEGLVGVALLADGLGGAGVRAAMVELNCETDFVGRTDEFRALCEAAARSIAYFAEPGQGPKSLVKLEWDAIKDIPVVPSSAAQGAIENGEVPRADELKIDTLGDSIAAMVSRLGENIKLRRAISVHLPPVPPRGVPLPLASTYLHGAPSAPASGTALPDPTFHAGTLGSLLLWELAPGGQVPKPEIKALLRSVARQAVAFPTSSVHEPAPKEGDASREKGAPSEALYEQSCITLQPKEGDKWASGAKVQEVLAAWSEARGLGKEGVVVRELARWEVGGEL